MEILDYYGYTPIMIDGSHESFEDNIALSKAVEDACRPSGVPVEAELGKVGGKEDDLDGGDKNPYPDPMEAKLFVERTGVDSLAVGIGTSHGIYKGDPNIRIDILKQIRDVVDIPLVLHGTSGVSDEVVKECIKNGICKVNYATDLRIAFTKGVKAFLETNPNVIDPKKYNAAGRVMDTPLDTRRMMYSRPPFHAIFQPCPSFEPLTAHWKHCFDDDDHRGGAFFAFAMSRAAKKRQYDCRKSLLLSRYLALFRHVANATHRDAAYAESR